MAKIERKSLRGRPVEDDQPLGRLVAGGGPINGGPDQPQLYVRARVGDHVLHLTREDVDALASAVYADRRLASALPGGAAGQRELAITREVYAMTLGHLRAELVARRVRHAAALAPAEPAC